MIQHVVQDQFGEVHSCRVFSADGDRLLDRDVIERRFSYDVDLSDFVMVCINDELEARIPLSQVEVYSVH